jgi:hypothetical protein
MRKTTVTIPAVEMTLAEENELWDTLMRENKLPGIHLWNTADGNNEIQFEGENFYRVIVRPQT